MRNLVEQEEGGVISPTAFIFGLDPLMPPEMDLYSRAQELPQEPVQKSVVEVARTNSRQEKKRLAGVRSREKKKKYLDELEQNVKLLTAELQKYQNEISNCKDQLVEAIRTANSRSNQHAFTYSQLQQQAVSEDPDIDAINHLLDLIQSRIGANAKERQTKLDYYFKQITNSLFPATHRYLMYCAEQSIDAFGDNFTTEYLQDLTNNRWTRELYAQIKLDQKQIKKHYQFKQEFKSKRKQSLECIKKLRLIRDEMKRQQDVFQRGISQFRLDLSPVQSALITVFGEKNKLRKEFSMGEELQFEQTPRKRVKIEQ